MWEYDQQMKLKIGLAEMLKGGVIMDVTNAEQAKIAEDAGACSVMALERVPADIRKEGGVARMASIKIIKEIMKTVTIPVMAKARIGHFAEAQVLENVGVDYIDESEVLTPADEEHHIHKWALQGPVCLRRAQPGRSAATHRRGRGDDPHQGRGRLGQHRGSRPAHARDYQRDAPADHAARRRTDGQGQGTGRAASTWSSGWPQNGKLPVPNFSAGGIATPADASLVMQLGAEAVFVGSGIFKSSDPAKRAKAIVRATTHYNDPAVVAECSEELGEAMRGIDVSKLDPNELLQTRGW